MSGSSLNRHNVIRITPSMKKRLISMFYDGKSDQEIGDALGLKERFVTNKRKVYGLRRDKQNRPHSLAGSQIT